MSSSKEVEVAEPEKIPLEKEVENSSPTSSQATTISSIPENDNEEQMSIDEEEIPKEPVCYFAEGEKVLCFHGALIYEARILKVEKKDNDYLYLVHYNGWNKKWNEKMNDLRILKYNKENLEKQRDLKISNDFSTKKNLQKSYVNDKKKSLGSESNELGSELRDSPSNSRSSTPNIFDEKGNKLDDKRSRVGSVESEAFFNKKQEVYVFIPDDLKLVMIEDWNAIEKKRQLCKLPATPCVDKIFDEYLNAHPDDEDAENLVLGVREYFDNILAAQLLFGFERVQMNDIIKKDENASKTFSDIYGFPHLIRFFTKIGQCLAYTTMTKQQVIDFQDEAGKFLAFLAEKSSEYFDKTDNYYSPTADYNYKVNNR